MKKEKIVTLDLTGCKSLGEIHQRIKKAFGFPDFYGENWDAFWDLIDGTRDNTMVEIQGISTMPKELREEAGKMILCLEDNIKEMEKLKQRRPDFDCRFSYRVLD